MRPAPRIALLAALGLLAGCPHRLGADFGPLLAEQGARAYVGGQAVGLQIQSTVNRRDFVYAIAIDPAGTKVAFTHLAPLVYRLGLFGGADLARLPQPPPIADPEIGSNEFDPEGLAWSPTGDKIAVASRDASVRVYDASGKLLSTYGTEEPLASLAWSPDGKQLIAGSEHGLLTVIDAATMTFGYDLRAHQDSVRALAFADDGTLWSGSWDKAVRSFRLMPESRAITEVRMHAGRKSGISAVHGTIDGKASVSLSVDARTRAVILTPQAALKAGIDPAFLKEHVVELTPAGRLELPIAHDHTLTFKNLTVPHVDVAVCGSCAPEGVDGVLGTSFTDRFEVALDEAHAEVIFRVKDPAQAATQQVPVLAPGARFELPGPVQDVTVSRDGKRLGVAVNEVRAERNLELYKREKKGQEEPLAAGNFAAILDAHDGKLLEKHAAHHGIVATATISPDGLSLASGGWDKQLFLFSGSDTPVGTVKYGWSVRRARYSADGRLIAVAAWTDQGPSVRNSDSDPAAQLLRVEYADPKVIRAP
jgi:hypothetical protein